MRSLLIEKLNLCLKEFKLKEINLEVSENELMVILGPTGAGKTLLLEAIAGFHNLDSGKIWLQGKEISILPPEKRDIGMIFQDHALFPHLTVEQNILFGTRYSRGELRTCSSHSQFEKLVDLLKIKRLLGRFPDTLSGGEKQRVSIARALITEPELLLFDEPLSALDEQFRANMREEIKAIVKRLGQTSIYVTHDQLEAVIIGDRVAMIEDGEILQVGSPQEIFYQPKNKKVAEFTGTETMLSGTIKSREEGLAVIDINGIRIEAVTYRNPGEEVTLCIRSENVGIEVENTINTRTSVRNRVSGKITKIIPFVPIIKVNLDCGIPLTASITKQSYEELGLTEGKGITASFKAVAVHVI